MGADLDLDATGDLRPATGAAAGRQRVLRRLLTNPGDYIWHLGYGAGVAAFVGQAMDAPRIAAVVRAQMFRERAVAPSPSPLVSVSPSGLGVLSVAVRYVDARGGQAVSAQLSIAP